MPRILHFIFLLLLMIVRFTAAAAAKTSKPKKRTSTRTTSPSRARPAAATATNSSTNSTNSNGFTFVPPSYRWDVVVLKASDFSKTPHVRIDQVRCVPRMTQAQFLLRVDVVFIFTYLHESQSMSFNASVKVGRPVYISMTTMMSRIEKVGEEDVRFSHRAAVH